jgi:hypothetical protein
LKNSDLAMWPRKHARPISRHGSNDNYGDLSSNSTTNEELDSNDDDEVNEDLEISSPKIIIMAKSPQTQFQNHEAQAANMRDTIKHLQHQLDTATDRIASFTLEKGQVPRGQNGKMIDGNDSLTESVNRKLRDAEYKKNLEASLRNVTAQAAVMLTERRDLHRELQTTKAITLATEAMMDAQVTSSLNQKKDILLKLKAIKSIIIFEDRAAGDDDDELDLLADDNKNNMGRCFCLPAIFQCWTNPVETPVQEAEKSSTEIERQIELSDNEILDEINRLYVSVARKLEECSNNAAMDLSEIETLKGVIAENTAKIAKKGHEIETIKGQLKDTKAQTTLMAKQQAELSAFYAKEKGKLQAEVAETKAASAAVEVAYDRQTERHSTEKLELRADFEYSVNNLESKLRKNLVSRNDLSYSANQDDTDES